MPEVLQLRALQHCHLRHFSILNQDMKFRVFPQSDSCSPSSKVWGSLLERKNGVRRRVARGAELGPCGPDGWHAARSWGFAGTRHAALGWCGLDGADGWHALGVRGYQHWALSRRARHRERGALQQKIVSIEIICTTRLNPKIQSLSGIPAMLYMQADHDAAPRKTQRGPTQRAPGPDTERRGPTQSAELPNTEIIPIAIFTTLSNAY